MLDQRMIGVNIARPWREVYAAAWRPGIFTLWASGMAAGNLREEGGTWHADGPDGAVTIRFTPQNDFGVMDHHVDTGANGIVYVPLRVVEN